MINLLEETLDVIDKNDLGILEDAIFIGSYDQTYKMTVEEFRKIADFEYDNGYGGQKIATDLIIAFPDGSIMERQEYDGSEWWEVKKPFTPKNIEHLPITKLSYGSWTNLERIHEEYEQDLKDGLV